MTRDEMLTALQSICIGARPTVITYDMGLQYEYVTHKGHGEGFGNMGDWPAYQLFSITESVLAKVQQKIINKSLDISDLEDTDLLYFYNYVFEIPRPDSCIPDINVFFADLTTVNLKSDGILYALCDARQWEPKAYFFSTYDELEEAFANYYATDVEEWNLLDDDELNKWLHRISEELDTIPFVILRDQEDDV